MLSVEFLGPWQRPGDVDAVDHRLDGPELRVNLVVEPVGADGELERRREPVVLSRHHPGREHDEIGRDLDLLPAGEKILHRDDERAVLAADLRRLGLVEPHEDGARLRTPPRRGARTCRTFECRGRGAPSAAPGNFLCATRDACTAALQQ